MPRLLALAAFLTIAVVPCALAGSVSPDTYWPHEDGREWQYLHRSTYFINPGTVDEWDARLWFDGTTVAPTNIVTQWLRSDVPSIHGGPKLLGDAPAEIQDPLLRAIWWARPDLRADVLEYAAEQPCSKEGVGAWFPITLRGSLAWEGTSPGDIEAWRCTLADHRAWIWIPEDLTPGTTRYLNTVPDVNPQLLVTTTVVGYAAATVPAGTFTNCLRVNYLVEYGWSGCYPGGVPSGTYRAETRGHILFAPGVGPVYVVEDYIVAEATGECAPSVGVGNPVARYELLLKVPSTVPAISATWGGVKAVYR